MTNEEKTEVMETVEMKENEQEQSRKERVLGYFKRNKKQCGVIAGALVLVVAGGGLAIASGNINPVDTLTGVNNNSTTSSAHSTTKANDAKNTSAMDADTQATEGDKSAEATSDGNNNTKATNSDTNASGSTQSASGATNASNSNSGTSTATNSASSHTHTWLNVYAQVYVVDKAAHDEPVYEQKEISVCNTCGADVSGFAGQHLLDTEHSSYKSATKMVQTGTKHYDEVGHYETVVTGYYCDCGTTKSL